MKRFFSILIARNKEFYRDKGTMIWTFAFPLLVILGFSFAFSGGSQDLYKVAIYPASATQHTEPALHLRYIQYIPVDSLEPAIEKVSRHQYDLLVAPDATGSGGKYWVNSSSPKGYFLEKILPSQFAKQEVTGRETRYVDWLIPGMLAMNMMFSALFGVGYTIVRYRKNGVLKRLKATPLSAVEFLAAQIGSRLTLVLLVSTLVFTGTHLLIGYPMYGSYLHLLLVFALGASSLIGIGLVIAARLRTEEMADGLLNLISWPMMFLSGIWFSLDGMHPWVQKLALIFPLTHVTTAARAVMIDGAGLATIAPQLGVLAGFTLVCLGIGAALFRWE